LKILGSAGSIFFVVLKLAWAALHSVTAHKVLISVSSKENLILVGDLVLVAVFDGN